MRSLRPNCALSVLLVAVLTAAAVQGQVVLAESDFENASEAGDVWIVTGDASNGGVPTRSEGCLRVDETANGATMFFLAPIKYLGNKRAAYGESIQFSLRIAAGGGIFPTNNDVQLWGAGLRLFANAGPIPAIAPDWSMHTVSLIETEWRILSPTPPYPAVSREDFERVLAHLEVLAIRAEYRDQNGETTWLDNVVMYGTCTPPAGDLDGDGAVGLSDLTTLLAAFGTICP